MTTVINGIDDLKSRIGQHLGYSDWHEVTQDQVNLFADATGDHQWIHIDIEKAKAGPFGGPIAHGYLTLSLGPMLMSEAFRVEGVAMGVNYGLDKMRFPSPVPVGSRVRVGVTLVEVTEVGGGVQYKVEEVFEIEGQDKPVCVAEGLFRAYSG